MKCFYDSRINTCMSFVVFLVHFTLFVLFWLKESFVLRKIRLVLNEFSMRSLRSLLLLVLMISTAGIRQHTYCDRIGCIIQLIDSI